MPDPTGIISKFVFIDSPWIDRGRVISRALSSNENKVREFKDSFVRSRDGDIKLSVVQNERGQYGIWDDHGVYIPIFEAAITIKQLRILAIELANYVAQPTRVDWDGKIVHRLIAA